MPSEAPGFDRYIVPTTELAEIVLPRIDAAAALYERSNMQHDMDAGPHAELHFRMSRYLGVDEKSVPRRIYSIRARETFGTGLDIADALLLCLGTRLDETDLPVFPSNILTAREMVKVHYPRMPEKERRKLAESIHHFTQGYIEESADDATLKWVREQNAKRKARTDRRRAELAEMRELVAA